MNEENKQRLIDFLNKEWKKDRHTEIRISIDPHGIGYAHVVGRDSETIDFALESSTPENPGPPPSGGK
jgi:hypothetical protein